VIAWRERECRNALRAATGSPPGTPSQSSSPSITSPSCARRFSDVLRHRGVGLALTSFASLPRQSTLQLFLAARSIGIGEMTVMRVGGIV